MVFSCLIINAISFSESFFISLKRDMRQSLNAKKRVASGPKSITLSTFSCNQNTAIQTSVADSSAQQLSEDDEERSTVDFDSNGGIKVMISDIAKGFKSWRMRRMCHSFGEMTAFSMVVGREEGVFSSAKVAFADKSSAVSAVRVLSCLCIDKQKLNATCTEVTVSHDTPYTEKEFIAKKKINMIVLNTQHKCHTFFRKPPHVGQKN